MNTTRMILIRESLAQSIARDAGSVAAAAFLILPGWWIDSIALQYTGAALFFILLVSRALGLNRAHTMTIAQAKAQIAAWEAEAGNSGTGG
jgi:hypothetical protein